MCRGLADPQHLRRPALPAGSGNPPQSSVPSRGTKQMLLQRSRIQAIGQVRPRSSKNRPSHPPPLFQPKVLPLRSPLFPLPTSSRKTRDLPPADNEPDRLPPGEDSTARLPTASSPSTWKLTPRRPPETPATVQNAKTTRLPTVSPENAIA